MHMIKRKTQKGKKKPGFPQNYFKKKQNQQKITVVKKPINNLVCIRHKINQVTQMDESCRYEEIWVIKIAEKESKFGKENRKDRNLRKSGALCPNAAVLAKDSGGTEMVAFDIAH